jgi:phosphoglycolate phosphatase
LISTATGALVNSFDITNELSSEFGYRRAESHEIETLRNSSHRSVAATLGIAWHKTPFIAARIGNELSRLVGDMPTFDGLLEALDELRSRGLRLGILTSNDRRNVEKFLTARELKYFDFITTSASVWGKQRRLKPLSRS